MGRIEDNVWQLLTATLLATIDRTSYASQSSQLRHFLCERKSYSSSDQVFMQQVLEPLYATHGEIRMERLAAQAHLSLRQLERRFKSLIGFSPKTLARFIRFETTRHLLMTQSVTKLTDLAHEAGYHDQAHWIKDFQAFAGCSPQQFIQRAKLRGMSPFYNPPRPRPGILLVI